ncbi:MAG: ATPase [Burkholderiales bacterium]|nr:ATPase [Burkholderiales bacterium]
MSIRFHIGVDGGGTGTRVAIAAPGQPEILARAEGGPGGLGLGRDAAWRNILASVAAAFSQLGLVEIPMAECSIGLGLAGVHNREWAAQFLAMAPVFGAIAVDTDGFTTLLGAHRGQPGAIIAVGTGVVGEVWRADGSRHTVSAWGFPNGDEGGGAWLGLRAAQLAQRALDGRAPHSPLADAVIGVFGGSVDAAFAWLGQARQTEFATLAPLVLAHSHDDPLAAALLSAAGAEIADVAHALDPGQTLPVALCGGLGRALQPWLPPTLRARVALPAGDAVDGALILAAQYEVTRCN